MSDVEIVSQDAWRRRDDEGAGRVPAGTVWVGGKEEDVEKVAEATSIEGLQPGVEPAKYWK